MKLIDLYPEYLQKSEEFRDIQNVLQLFADRADKDTAEAYDNMFISTARGEMLDRYEKSYGINDGRNLTEAQRQQRLVARQRIPGTATKEKIKKIANSFNNGEVEVSEDCANYTVTIDFIDHIGTPDNLPDLKTAIEDVLPQHVTAKYNLRFKRWDDYKSYTWEDLNNKTWNDAKEGH